VNAGQVKATMLDYRFLSDGSSHSISLQFVRPVSSSYSYIDNMWVSAIEQVPEPSTFGLLLAGLGCVMLRHRAARVSKRLLGSSEPTAA
jgi:hypothetical protein